MISIDNVVEWKMRSYEDVVDVLSLTINGDTYFTVVGSWDIKVTWSFDEVEDVSNISTHDTIEVGRDIDMELFHAECVCHALKEEYGNGYDYENIHNDILGGDFTMSNMEDYKHENIIQASKINGQHKQADLQRLRYGKS